MLTQSGTFEARARPLQASLREKLLFIGLGQTGLQALNLLFEMMRQSLPPREFQRHTRLLAIAQQRSFAYEHQLPRDLRLLISQPVVRWSEVPGRYATHGVARWWARTPNHIDLQANPTPSRSFNRLLLWNNAQLIGEKLYQMADWLHTTGERDVMPPRIMVLASLAEAESSGMIFDVVGRLRQLLPDAPIIGIMTTAAPYQNEEERYLAQAHTYATLKELDAINLSPALYPHELPFVGVSGSLSRTTRPILNQICITGDTRQPDPAPEAGLAEFAITWLLNSLNPEAPPLLNINGSATDHLDRFRGYTAFGLAKLALPVRATLDLQAIELATTTLESLLINHNTSYKGWIQQVLKRAHHELLTHHLRQHHLLKDRLAELRRRITFKALSSQVGSTKSGLFSLGSGTPRGDTLLPLLHKEWRLLQRETDAEELTPEGVTVRRDVLWNRIEDAMETGFRKLLNDLDAAVVHLAYEEGHGLAWTYRLYQELSAQVEAALNQARHAVEPAHARLEDQRESWMNAVQDRNPDVFDEQGQALLDALVEWIGWQVRIRYWEGLRDTIDDNRDRLRLMITRITPEIERLKQLHFELQTELETACQFGPQFPNGALCSPDWIKHGTRQVVTRQNQSPQALVAAIFSKWDARQYDGMQQLQQFPLQLLPPARLTLQPQTQFSTIHEFVQQHQQVDLVRQSLIGVQANAVPQWSIRAETGKLESLQLQFYEAVRQSPQAYPLINRPAGQVIQHRVPSPDPDEITLLRMAQGWAAEHVKELRDEYRRAYYRVASDNVPLHIDRRWETTMADLIQTSIRAEVSSLWEGILKSLHRGAEFALQEMQQLARLLAQSLEADDDLQLLPTHVQDIQMMIFNLPSFQLKVPPPRCAFIFLMAQRSGQEISDDILKIVLSTVLEENFFFLINLVGRTDIESIVAPLRNQSYMPLVLSESDMKHLISAPKPQTALRDIVVERIQLTAVSPFYTRAPVPDHMFFGRDREIADVRSKLNTGSVVLIGGRRIGKTSTLQKIMRTIENDQDSVMMPHYLDCSNVLEYRHFFRRIARDWKVPIDPDSDPVEFDEVVDYFRRQYPGKLPVFLLDEVDRLLKTDQVDGYSEPLFRTFRSLSNQNYCQFLFSGEKLLLHSIKNAHSVLFNFPKEVPLGPLDRHVVERLVKEPFEMLNIWLEDVNYLLKQIYDISAGHPNIVQTICHALVAVLDQDSNTNIITRDHLGRALDNHHVQVDIVTTIWGQMHPIAKLITLLWEEDVIRKSAVEIIKMLHEVGLKNVPTQFITGQVIPDLELYNFVQPKGQDYELRPVHFPTILAFMTDKRLEIQSTLENIRHELQNTRTPY